MTDVIKTATRDAYGKALAELGAEKQDLIVFDADLAGATKTSTFQKVFPDRHFDCGIAEGNMIAVAAGAATMGLVPFASSFAMFAAGRAFEQVRNSIGYPHLNVKIGATHGGISVGEDGASHQCCEDFALMRSIPGMTVICPADGEETRLAVRAAQICQNATLFGDGGGKTHAFKGCLDEFGGFGGKTGGRIDGQKAGGLLPGVIGVIRGDHKLILQISYSTTRRPLPADSSSSAERARWFSRGS